MVATLNNSLGRSSGQKKSGGSFYSYGGGSIGGVWNYKKTLNPFTGKYVDTPTLDPRFYAAGGGGRGLTGTETVNPITFEKRQKINIVPAGMSGKQEYQWMKGSGDWVEAPEKWNYDYTKGGFYNPQGKKWSGTIMGTGSYGGFGGGKEPKPEPTQLSQEFAKLFPRQDAALTAETKATQGEMGATGQPIAFTGFGEMAQAQAAEETVSPIGEGFGSIGTDFYGAPRFPFAGAKSAFERGAALAQATVGVPRFPFSGY
jgi:hypothetical protein